MKKIEVNTLPVVDNQKHGWPWIEDNKLISKDIYDRDVWPIISIVTPSFNQGQFLEETIRSVLLQGYPNLEYIIIDGGSTDGSIEIIKKYEPWISCWVSEEDDGQAAAINKGFNLASGEILAWLNSDDLYLKGTLHEIGRFFLHHKDVDLVYGGCQKISSKGKILNIEKATNYDFQKLLMHNIIAQPSAFFTKRFFSETGPLNEKMRYCFDVELWVKGSLSFRYKNHPKIFSKFRYHDDSKTVSQNLRMSKEASEVSIGVLEMNKTSHDFINKCIRLRYLNLAVWQWRIDKKNTKRIKAYLEKANINDSLFAIESTSHIVRPFLDLKSFLMQKPKCHQIEASISDMREFYREYIQPSFVDNLDKYLNRLVVFAYLKISLRQKNPYYFIKAIFTSLRYTVQLINLQIKK